MSISVIVPSYRNPEYLELCIRSLLRHQRQKNEIIVVLDGFKEMYGIVMNNYKNTVKWLWLDDNQGLSMSTNVGVYNASNERILIINEDNIAPPQWDEQLNKIWEPNTVYAIQQIEPRPSIFKFLIEDCGDSLDTFSYEKFSTFEHKNRNARFTDDAYTLPIFMNKKWFMAVGGWDVSYQSPFVVDLDFFLKLQLIWSLEFKRAHHCAFYHFGSMSTKNRPDATDEWHNGESYAAQQFEYKWGVPPRRLPNSRIFMGSLRSVTL